MNYSLKIPVYISDEGPFGAIWMFLLAGAGFLLIKIGQYMDDYVENSCLSAFGEVFIKKIGIGLFLTGIISGIISLF